MYPERQKMNRIIVITTKRKVRGMGADKMGNERQNETGKVGRIFATDGNGERREQLCKEEGATFTDLSKKLHATKLIPRHVAIKHRGETRY